MADAWAAHRGAGRALVTAGPGHCNAISALYGALMAESPVVLLSGHAPTAQLAAAPSRRDGPGRGGRAGLQGRVDGEGRRALGEDTRPRWSWRGAGGPARARSLPGDLLEVEGGDDARGRRREPPRRPRPRR
jgi:acetolactate synthase-1/2/3 large subunit